MLLYTNERTKLVGFSVSVCSHLKHTDTICFILLGRVSGVHVGEVGAIWLNVHYSFFTPFDSPEFVQFNNISEDWDQVIFKNEDY